MCVCRCCKTPNCTPQVVGSLYLNYCYESACTTECTTSNFATCVAGGPGVARGECNGGPDRLLSPLFMVFGLTSIIMMIKNKF